MFKAKAVFGLLPTEASAIQAADALKAAGFPADHISALFPDKSYTSEASVSAPRKVAAR
jgi:hypothetical protein